MPTEEVRENQPWCVLYAVDAILVAKSRSDLEAKLERWRQAMGNRGMKISSSKTEKHDDRFGKRTRRDNPTGRL